MNRFEGLNLPQLMDLLHDLRVPEPVSWLPQTVGWRILAAWLIVVVLLWSWHIYRRWRKNAYRRDALGHLSAIEARGAANPVAAAEQIASLLKRTAIAGYSRHEVAQLYGAQWAQFLRESAGHHPDLEQAADKLAVAAYRADADGRALVAPARQWIEHHRA